MKFTMKQAAQYRKITREEVAKELGVSMATVTKYYKMESMPSIDKVLKFCKLTNFNINDLIFLKTDLILNQQEEAKEK